MATRLPYNTEIDFDILTRIGQGEAYLRTALPGNIRLRLHGDLVRLEVDSLSFSKVMERQKEITEALKSLGFIYITLDLEGFRSGSMDIELD